MLIKEKITEQVFIDRLKELATICQIGYHGHFYKGEKEIKSPIREKETVTKQFRQELDWFNTHQININSCYAGGWWYTNKDLMELLVNNNFQIDFTFSYNPNYRNPFSKEYLKNNNLAFGQPLSVNNVKYLQTLIGCHNTPFVEDFRRNLNKLVNNIPCKKKIIGALCTHDYNLKDNFNMTIDCIKDLIQSPNVSFLDLNDLDKIDYKIITNSNA